MRDKVALNLPVVLTKRTNKKMAQVKTKLKLLRYMFSAVTYKG